MVAKPPLPDAFNLPSEVNGRVHHPELTRNGHVWTGVDADRSVAVFSHFGTTVIAVFDDRVDGFANRIEPVRRDICKASYDPLVWRLTARPVRGEPSLPTACTSLEVFRAY